MKLLSILIFTITIISCKQVETPLSAQAIIDKAIANSCNGNCEHASIDFTFRDRRYVSKRKGGNYQYERITVDSTGITRDILTNNGFNRYKNDTLIIVPDSMETRYSNSINSVHYFAQLPYGLNAPAAQKELAGEAMIKGEPYFKIGVKFAKEGGGQDFEDEFVYWIHKENYTMDYVGYSYTTDGGGIRFREAYNAREVNGIRFVDYNNYKPSLLEADLTDLDELFEKGELILLSKIETESVGVVLGK
jgi:CRISPR/Cas system CSM-associated protein Csm3 (group 7 of RAMP superfamily)